MRNPDKERGISWARYYKQILIRNRTKRIRKGSIPTVKLLFCIPEIHTGDLCPAILVVLTSFISKARTTLWCLFLLSKGKRAVPASPPQGTPTHTQPHQQHTHHTVNSSLLSKGRRRRKRSQAGDTATDTRCNGWCEEWLYSDDVFESGYKTLIIQESAFIKSDKTLVNLIPVGIKRQNTCNPACCSSSRKVTALFFDPFYQKLQKHFQQIQLLTNPWNSLLARKFIRSHIQLTNDCHCQMCVSWGTV